MLAVVVLTLALSTCAVFAAVYAQRRRRKRRWDKEETDWMPGHGVANDIQFVNPKYDETVSAPSQI